MSGMVGSAALCDLELKIVLMIALLWLSFERFQIINI